jgi:hypothetical protein
LANILGVRFEDANFNEHGASNLLKFNGPHRLGTPSGTEWAMPSGFFIRDVIRLN